MKQKYGKLHILFPMIFLIKKTSSLDLIFA